MPQAKPSKPTEVNPWGWVTQVSHEDVKSIHILSAYRINGFFPCLEARRNCKRNPYCVWGLGEKKWREDNEGDEDEEGGAFRCEGEYAGLQNLGATCYVNSLLQLWFHNPIFRPAILKWAPATDINLLTDYKPNCPLAQLQAIFARLKISKRSKIDPSDFVSSLLLNTGEQQDAQEFAKLFMDFIVNLLTEYGDDQIQKLIDQSFNGQLQYETECQGCKNRTRRSESFTELNLSVKKNLNESLDELLADEIISDEYMCSNCHQKNTAKRRMQLTKLPPIMNLQLLRFVYDREANRRKKVTQSISFPEVLEMNQRIHRPNNLGSSPSEYKYHLTAVLIHNGQSASSGHYVAQIKDLRNGEWLKFNDEFVDLVNKGKSQKSNDNESDDQDKKSRPKKSKNSPSLSSTGAYMLVYTLEKYIKNPEPDPELHQYLVELVRREDTSFELEVNKNKSEKDFELAVKNQRRKEVEWLYEFKKKSAVPNGTQNSGHSSSAAAEGPKPKVPRYDVDLSDSEPMDVDNSPISPIPCDSTKNGHTEKNKLNGISSEVSSLPLRKKSYGTHEIDFVSVDWISQWLDPVNPVPPIENIMLLCEHKKLAPPSPSSIPCLYRIVPTPLANVWYENYQGSPRLKSEDLCDTCVRRQCRKLRALADLEEDSKQLSELVKRCDSECSPYLKVGQEIPTPILVSKVWISKESLKNWKKIAKRAIDGPSPAEGDQNKENEVQVSSEEGNENMGSFNADLFCEHGNMSPDVSSRKLIPREAWTIIEKYFKNSVMLEATENSSCDDCRNLEHQNTMEVQRNKEIAAKQRSSLADLYSNRNRPDIDKIGELYIVSTSFVLEWKRFIKDPSRHSPVVNINNRTLICEHDKFMYPIMFVSEFLHMDEDADEMVLLITPEEWQFMKQNFECDQEIKVKVINLLKKDNLEYKPDICNNCAESWLEGAFRKQFQYQDAPVYVIRREKGETIESDDEDAPKTAPVVSGKREVKPVNPDAWMQGFSSSNSVRRSNRPRNSKGEKTYKVSATTTIKELKSKICSDFKALLSDQHLYYGSKELDNLAKKLEDYNIPAGAKLYLEIDTAENGSIDEPMSTVETGFQGTLLQGGSAFSDTRSPLQHS